MASIIYLTGLMRPPHLMDDVDAAEALQAKNMLLSGDWVTQHLNGTPYFDKAPLKYWVTAGLYDFLGIHDWVARLPTVIAAVMLCWLVVRMGRWACGVQTGFYSGMVLATSIGLFLFTRTVIPDVILTLFIALAIWCFFRLMESAAPSWSWAMGMYASLALAVLTKGFVGLVLPAGVALLYLVCTRRLLDAVTWRRLLPWQGWLLFFAIAAPWHVLATVRNPPVIDWTLNPGAHFGGQFRGFFWFYFINEQVLRFLNLRWPRDYNTVPRFWFYAYHLVWFFPWSFYLAAVARLSFKPVDRAARLRLLAVCWVAVVMLFFTLSTTQEYYSMPMYPAAALLLGSGMQRSGKWPARVSGGVCVTAALGMSAVLAIVWRLPTPGDIFSSLIQHPSYYTLSLGHMADLTLPAFAYLRAPLTIACVALLAGGIAALMLRPERASLALACMMVLFFQAARLALGVFDPYLSSYAVAQKLNQLPRGRVLICGKYNPLSSVFFYSRDGAVQNDQDLDILEYGTLAPGAPKIELGDGELKLLWSSEARVYLISKVGKLAHVREVLGLTAKQALFQSGDKYLFVNRP